MPQVDLENLVSACAGACSDTKIACADDDDDVIAAAVNVDPDFPPESFWLSKDAEYDWFDRTAFYYERKDSTKGHPSTNSNSNSNSNSQRFSVSLKSKAGIIGLPKTQKNTYIDSKRRFSKPPNVKLFPKRSDPVVKSISMAEPGSPKVSCMGRVRSKRCRRRSNSLKMKEKSIDRSRSGGDKQKAGIYSKVMSMFRSKKGRKKTSRSGSRKVSEEERWSVSSKGKEIPVGCNQTTAEAPGLGGVKRFTSGRRSGSWTDDDFNQTISASRVGRS